MRIQIMSDVHTEFAPSTHWLYTYAPEGKQDTVLVLAGDIGSHGNTLAVPNLLAQYYRAVVLVAGNHDWYGLHFDHSITKLLTRDFDLKPNVHILDRSAVDIDGTVFAGATLWTSFDGDNPLTMMRAPTIMSDYSRVNGMTPGKVLYKHKGDVNFLESVRADVIVTHHLPSFQFINPRFRGARTNGYYASNLDSLILDKAKQGAKLWVFGHTHDSINEEVDNLKVICNPYGYDDFEVNDGFDRDLTIEI